MISGEKVILKGITKDSVKKLYDWVNQEDTRVFTGTLYPVSEYEHEEWVRRQVTESDGKLFLICEKRTGNEIGIIGLKHFDYINSNAELFIRIGEEDYRSRTKTPKSEGGGRNRIRHGCCYYADQLLLCTPKSSQNLSACICVQHQGHPML